MGCIILIISRLQRALKKKMEEVSELEIRRDMAEKKLQSVQKDRDTKVANLERQIETMRGKEIQHEEEVKRIQEDYETAESERRKLYDQLNKSARTLERTMQTANISMVTAQDTSLASLGISLQSPQSVHQASPVHHQMSSSMFHQNNQSTGMGAAGQTPGSSSFVQSTSATTTGMALPESAMAAQATVAAAALGSLTSPLGPNRRLFSSTPATMADGDETIFLRKFKELSAAFDQAARRNYDLELELAYNQLNSKVPPYNSQAGSTLASVYDLDRARKVREEISRLKREIRASMINQQICPRSRAANAQSRQGQFRISQLAMKCYHLEQEASSLMSSSRLVRSRATGPPLLQSTPVK
jgi:hypothetical protein